MPTKIEKDDATGRMTTGHEWDGLKELNQPLPKWWLYVFWATVVWSLGYFVAYPTIPGVAGYLGWTQRGAVARDLAEVEAKRAGAMERIRDLPFDAIRKDPALMAVARVAGRIAYAENCQGCHGAGGAGAPGFPALAAGAWIWGGKIDEIRATIEVGVRSSHPDTRQSAMPRFGADGILKPEEIAAVADHAQALYGGAPGPNAEAGKRLFAENCAVCHGPAGEGVRDVGGPRLASRVHLYGSDRDAILAQIREPKHGAMPSWRSRLDEARIKALALHVHDLGGGE